jgi:Na+-transporting NADH:ubiquinone oxidoreductase subunit F
MPDFAVQLLIAVGVAGAVTVALALLLVIADATIANYGQVTITVNDGNEYLVEGGRPLLATLKDERIFIPSACGGRGSCGLCKARIAEGAGEVLPTELPWLTDEERAAGTRLTCQIKVKRDVRMYVPDELLSVRQFTTEVAALRDLTYDIKEVTLALLEPARMDFVAGQFIQFEVPAYELTSEPVYRAYSIASDPADPSTLQLEIRLVPNGICTTYVHRHLKVGDRVTINGPHGDFRLRQSEREIVFIAGGSGMAPIRSILLDMARTSNPRHATYFFGARTRRDLFLVEEMRALEKTLPHFSFVPSLSAPAPEDEWDGESGLITDIVERRAPSGENVEAYLCGSPGMIDAAVKCLVKKGVPEDRIFYDKFA